MLKRIAHIILLLLLCLLFSCKKEIAADKEKENVFVKYFGSNNQDEGIKIIKTKDDGYYILGNTSETDNNSNVILIKTDIQGNKIWEKQYGTSLKETVVDIKYAHDNNIYIIANQLNNETKNNIYAIKTNLNGDIIWERSYGKTLFNEIIHSVTSLSDNTIILTGTTDENSNFDLYYIKISTNGDSLWYRTFGNANFNEYGTNIIENNNQIFIFYDSESAANAEKIMKAIEINNIGLPINIFNNINTTSDLRLEQIFWNTEQQAFIGISNQVLQAPNSYQIAFHKINQQFELNQSLLFSASKSDIARQIIKTTDNGYAIIGSTSSYGEGKDDIYLLRLDAGGNKLFYKTYGGIGDDRGYSILETKDEGFVITGSTEYEGNTMICLIKTNKNGELLPE